MEFSAEGMRGSREKVAPALIQLYLNNFLSCTPSNLMSERLSFLETLFCHRFVICEIRHPRAKIGCGMLLAASIKGVE
jgi:hypothetical protein